MGHIKNNAIVFIKSFGSLLDKYFWKIMFISVLLNMVLFGIFVMSIAWVLSLVDFTGIIFLETIITWLGTGAAFLLSYFLFPLVLPLITVFFLDSITSHTEEKYNYTSEKTNPVPIARSLAATARFMCLSICLNILFLPLYLIPIINIFVYYILNGILLGREYFELVALRHETINDAISLRKKNRYKMLVAGILITIMSTIPVLNLFTHVIAVIFMTHVYHKISRHCC